MQPCEQQDNIINISRTLERMERGQERVVELLEKVANQDARIDHLEESSERNYTEVNELFTRMRECELNIALSGPNVRQQFNDSLAALDGKLERFDRFMDFINHKLVQAAAGLLALLILAGTLLDFIYHYVGIKTVLGIIK